LATAFDSAWSVSGHVLFRSVRAGAPGLGVDGWEKSQELRSGKYTVRDHNFEMTGKSLEDKKTIVQAKGAGLVQAGQVPHHVSLGGNHEMELYAYPGGYAKRYDEVAFLGGGDQAPFQEQTFRDAARVCKIRMQEELAPGLVIRGTGNRADFSAGFKMTVTTL